MVKSLGKSIVEMYSMGACAVLGMSNQDAPSEDLESDPFLNSALQGSYLAPLSVGIITSRHYLSERGIKNGEQMETTDLTNEQPAVLSKYAGFGAAMAAELIIGFWFGIGVILAIRIVDNQEYCVEMLMSSK